jgi:ribonuclease-3
VLGSGVGRTKKAAEQQAAEAAWRRITAEAAGEDLPPDNPGAAGNGDGTDPNRES